MRDEVPEPHAYKVCLGTFPRATLSGRAALLTQEGLDRAELGSFMHSHQVGESHSSIEILRGLGKAFGMDIPSSEAAEVFLELASRVAPFAGMTYGLIGLSGKLVKQEPDSAVAAD